MAVKINWYEKSRKRCCDTKCCLKMIFADLDLPVNQDITFNVFLCDIGFTVTENGKFIRNGMLEFFTS